MHCKACDKILSPSEIVYNKQLEEFELCATCLEIALDAAFSGGFSPDNDVSVEHLTSITPTIDPEYDDPSSIPFVFEPSHASSEE